MHRIVPLTFQFIVACGLVTSACTTSIAASSEEYDIVIYGGTSAGVIAAVQAKIMGKSVAIICPDKHLGGLSSGGLGWTDSGKKEVIGGLSRQFYQRIKKYYDQPGAWKFQKPQEYSRYRPDDDAMWVFEPHIAEKVFEDLVREYKIPVHRDQWLNRRPGEGVKLNGKRIESIAMLSGKTWRGSVFIDATYEGDLMAAAGVSYTVGREGNDQYDETLNGVQTRHARSHQFRKGIDPYVVPGNPSSGLLPRIHPGGPGEEGKGDHRVQAYCYRMCLTQVEENRVPFAKPAGYDARQYELLLRSLQAGSRHVFGKFDPAPNAKTDTNNHGSFSTDNIGMNYDYPDASYERRREILAEHETYQKGYLYFLCNDPRVPQDVREKMSKWGLAKDEFLDNGNWPHQIYVREARRMVGDFVVTENHLRRRVPTPRPIGMGSYNMDSHNVQRYVDEDGNVRNEGDIQINPGGPYPIDFGAIVPKRSECGNLLVPVAVSSSHIAYGSIRMEPVFMILGQSAATAAAMAIDGNTAVQDVDYFKLSKRLLDDGQVLETRGPRATVKIDSAPRPARSASKTSAAPIDRKQLTGIVIDDEQAQMTGTWTQSQSVGPYLDKGYRHDGNTAKGKCTMTFTAKLPKPGEYEVRLAYTANGNRAGNVPVTIYHSKGTTTVTINQKQSPPIDGAWVSLGKFAFDKQAKVVIANDNTNGYVIADAVQWLP